MDDLLNAVSNYGFPMAVSIFLLIRIEAKIERLSESIHALSEVIRRWEGGVR